MPETSPVTAAPRPAVPANGKPANGARPRGFAMLRAAADAISGLAARARFATGAASVTFNGRRDLYEALGYKRALDASDYRKRYARNAVAARVIETMPKSTWRGGGELVEDENNAEQTEFEKAWVDLNLRLNVWSTFLRADLLAGFGRYAIIVLGTTGDPTQPLKSLSPDGLAYLSAFSEEEALISEFDTNRRSPRFGLPVYYTIRRRVLPSGTAGASEPQLNTRIHYTHVVHVADGLLDDHVFGTPRLERVWNLIDDLEKVVGGGAEAFWKRADQGLQLDLDPTLPLEDGAEEELEEQVDAYTHGLERVLLTRGVTPRPLGSDVADFKGPSEAIVAQISAGTSIPQRILMGSERGQLASTHDRDNWAERVADRRVEFAGPQVVRPFADLLIRLGVLPTPVRYEVRWPEIQNLDDSQKASIALQWASVNDKNKIEVVTVDEIRDLVLGLPPKAQVAPSPGGPAPAEPAAPPKAPAPQKTAKQRRLARFHANGGYVPLAASLRTSAYTQAETGAAQ